MFLRYLQDSGQSPARHKRTHQPTQGDEERRESLRYGLGRRFCAAQPNGCGQYANHQVCARKWSITLAMRRGGRSLVHLKLIKRAMPRISTTTGTHRCRSVRIEMSVDDFITWARDFRSGPCQNIQFSESEHSALQNEYDPAHQDRGLRYAP